MLKNFSSKLLPIILFVVLVLMIAPSQKYIRRFLRVPKTFETVESSDSELLGLLLNKSSFTKDWQWDLIITHQQNHLSNNSNVQEWASRQLVGYHDGRDVFLFHTISMYLEPTDVIDVEPLSSAIGVDSFVDQTPISIPQDSTFSSPVCHMGMNNKEIQVTACVLARKYKSIHEKIDVVVYGNVDIKEVSEVVRNIVMFFDSKEVNIR